MLENLNIFGKILFAVSQLTCMVCYSYIIAKLITSKKKWYFQLLGLITFPFIAFGFFPIFDILQNLF